MTDTIIAMAAVAESEGLAGATEIEVTEEMAMEGALARNYPPPCHERRSLNPWVDGPH